MEISSKANDEVRYLREANLARFTVAFFSPTSALHQV